MSTPLTPPPALRLGDAVSLVAPASGPDPTVYSAAVQELRSWGYEPRTYRDITRCERYLAGPDDDRAAELNEAFADPETKAVIAVRGGYGVMRILDRVDFDRLSARPKIVCGYSDITALHAAVQTRCGMVSFHGPNLIAGLGDASTEAAAEREAFYRLAAGDDRVGSVLGPRSAEMAQTIQPGVARGRLVGGNVALVAALVGTEWMPETAGAILLLEDIGEPPYRVDRLLAQLRLAGVLDSLAGVVCGYFTDCVAENGPRVEEVLRGYLEPLGVPVVLGFPAGHEHPNPPLPLGAEVELDADACMLTLLSPAVAT